MSRPNRKPHLLRAKQEIVAILDIAIKGKVANLPPDDLEAARETAIFIRQRNRLAKDAQMPEIPVAKKDAQGRFIYEG